MDVSRSFYLSVLVGLLFISTAICIKCFQCNSFEDPVCADLKKNDTASKFYKECEQRDNHQMFCRKTSQKIVEAPKIHDEFTRITRECGWIIHKKNENNCRKINSDFKFETSCQCFEDACNGAPFKLGTAPLALTVIACLFLTHFV